MTLMMEYRPLDNKDLHVTEVSILILILVPISAPSPRECKEYTGGLLQVWTLNEEEKQ
jgi:hypothetical protein